MEFILASAAPIVMAGAALVVLGVFIFLRARTSWLLAVSGVAVFLAGLLAVASPTIAFFVITS